MSSRSGWGRFCEAGGQGSARPTRALGGSVGLGSFFGAAVATRADAGRLHEKSRSPLAEGLSLDGWEAAARVSARGPREPAGVGLRKGERTSAGGAPGRGGGKRGAGRVPGRRGGVGTRGVCTEGPGGPGHGPRPSPPKHVRRRRFGAAAAPAPAHGRGLGRPRLPAGTRRPRGALRASRRPPPGREPGRARRGGSGPAVRVREGSAASGRGEGTKPASPRGATASGEGHNASGGPNALKGQCAARGSC